MPYQPDESEETLAWWSLTPAQRFRESQKLWHTEWMNADSRPTTPRTSRQTNIS